MIKNLKFKLLIDNAVDSMINDKNLLSSYTNYNKYIKFICDIREKILAESLSIGEDQISKPQLLPPISVFTKYKIKRILKNFLKEIISKELTTLLGFYVDSSLNKISARSLESLVLLMACTKSFEKKAIISIKNNVENFSYNCFENGGIIVLEIQLDFLSGYSHLVSLLLSVLKEYLMYLNPEKFFVLFLDDDAIPENENIFLDELHNYLNNKKLYFVSGTCMDNRKNVSLFHNFANIASLRENLELTSFKPYTQGGGSCSLLPLNSISFKKKFDENILPGIYLNTLCIDNLSIESLKDRENRNIPWFTTTIPELTVEHPTKQTLSQWSKTRLQYYKSWQKAFLLMDQEKSVIYRNLLRNKKEFMLNNLIKKYTGTTDIEIVFGYVFITVYYKRELINKFYGK